MPTRDFIPEGDDDLLAWSANFSALLTSTPIVYGTTAPVASAYASKHTSYATALAKLKDAATQSPMNVTLKNQARADLVANARAITRTIQGTGTVTPAMKQQLGINPRNTVRQRIPAPGTSPELDIVYVQGKTVRVRVHSAESNAKRGRPPGVQGVTFMSFIGDELPVSPSDYKLEGSTSATTLDIVFPNDVPAGTTAHVCAFWFNPRAESGPACPPRSVTLGGNESAVPVFRIVPKPVKRAA